MRGSVEREEPAVLRVAFVCAAHYKRHPVLVYETQHGIVPPAAKDYVALSFTCHDFTAALPSLLELVEADDKQLVSSFELSSSETQRPSDVSHPPSPITPSFRAVHTLSVLNADQLVQYVSSSPVYQQMLDLVLANPPEMVQRFIGALVPFLPLLDCIDESGITGEGVVQCSFIPISEVGYRLSFDPQILAKHVRLEELLKDFEEERRLLRQVHSGAPE